MRNRRAWPAVLGLLAFGGTGTAQVTTAPQAVVVQEEEVEIIAPAVLEQHFSRAKEGLLKQDAKLAAAELRKAADEVEKGAARAGAEAKAAASDVGRDLRTGAEDVEKGVVTSADDLQKIFARAHYDLARHYRARAQAGLQSAPKASGHHLRAAAAHLEHAAEWAGQETREGAVKVADGARLVAGKLISGSGWAGEEVGKAVESLGGELDRLGRKIEPAGDRPASAPVPAPPAPAR